MTLSRNSQKTKKEHTKKRAKDDGPQLMPMDNALRIVADIFAKKAPAASATRPAAAPFPLPPPSASPPAQPCTGRTTWPLPRGAPPCCLRPAPLPHSYPSQPPRRPGPASASRRAVAQVREDGLSDAKGKPRMPIVKFVHNYMLRQYGMKHVADKAMRDLEHSIRTYCNGEGDGAGMRDQGSDGPATVVPRVQMFGEMMGMLSSAATCAAGREEPEQPAPTIASTPSPSNASRVRCIAAIRVSVASHFESR